MTDEAVWIDERFQEAQQFACAPPIGLGNGAVILDSEYRSKAKAEADRRAALAAVRLAGC